MTIVLNADSRAQTRPSQSDVSQDGHAGEVEYFSGRDSNDSTETIPHYVGDGSGSDNSEEVVHNGGNYSPAYAAGVSDEGDDAEDELFHDDAEDELFHDDASYSSGNDLGSRIFVDFNDEDESSSTSSSHISESSAYQHFMLGQVINRSQFMVGVVDTTSNQHHETISLEQQIFSMFDTLNQMKRMKDDVNNNNSFFAMCCGSDKVMIDYCGMRELLRDIQSKYSTLPAATKSSSNIKELLKKAVSYAKTVFADQKQKDQAGHMDSMIVLRAFVRGCGIQQRM